MKNRLKIILWAIKMNIANNLKLYLTFIILGIFNTILQAYIIIFTGNIINSINLTDTLSSTFQKLNLWFCLNIIVLIISNVYILLRNDIIPQNMKVYLSELKLNITENIPIVNFDKPEFLDEYYQVCTGIDILPDFISNIVGVVRIIISVLLALAVACSYHFSFLILIIISFIIGFFLTLRTPKIKAEIWKEVSKKERVTNYISSLFSSKNTLAEMRVFGYAERYIKYYKDTIKDMSKCNYKKMLPQTFKFSLWMFFNNFSGILILIIGVFYLKSMHSSDIGMLYTMYNMNISALNGVQGLIRSIIDLNENFEMLKVTMDFYYMYSNPDDDNVNTKNDKSTQPGESVNDIAFSVENVSFSYDNNTDILKNINIEIKKGETIAICGENGSGKSTLVKVLLGLYKPHMGSIKIWGHNIEEYPNYPEKEIGVVFQDFCRYPLTLRENVGFGDINNLENDSKILNAIKKGDGRKILKKMSSIDALLGREIYSDGYEISGGEWQRIALARLYMNNKNILIFDEPASKLDPIAELKQFENLKQNLSGRTAILISHRIGFARLADRIIIIDKGIILESGTHDELIKLNGKYKYLFDSQAQWYTV